MGQDNQDTYRADEKETIDTGSDLPHGDGTVSDEDTNKVIESQTPSDKPIGQDHSLDNYEDSEPRDGVGAIQSSTLIDNVAHIADDEGEEE